MPTNKEKYKHDEMSDDELEARLAADLYELSERLQETKAKPVGRLLWILMFKVREAYRTAKLINEASE